MKSCGSTLITLTSSIMPSSCLMRMNFPLDYRPHWKFGAKLGKVEVNRNVTVWKLMLREPWCVLYLESVRNM